MGVLKKYDPEVYAAITGEISRQRHTLELIASENFTSPRVLQAMGSVLTNKYAEGYPGKRYYGGCEYVDQSEQLARDRAKQLFHCDHANVQPHSGTQANFAAYAAVLQSGDKLLGMDITQGGHLSHGSPVNFSGKIYKPFKYGLNPQTELIDLDEVADICRQVRPKVIIAGASAYPRTVDFEGFRRVADEVGAVLIADIAHIAGLVATGLHPSPVGHAQIITTSTHKTLRGPRGGMILCQQEYARAVDRAVFPGQQGGPLMHIIAAKAVAFKEALEEDYAAYCRKIVDNAHALAGRFLDEGLTLVTGGTDNHLMMINLTPLGLTGKWAQDTLEEVGITTNKNMVPKDPQGPTVTSGIRIGTPALTTRGLGQEEMKLIGGWIAGILKNPQDEGLRAKIKKQVAELCGQFPLYPEMEAQR